jgi:hypothetical protein
LNRATRLESDEIAMLDAIRFDWRPLTFDRRLAALRAFRSKHGHCRPSREKNGDLYEFCARARRARRHPDKDDMLLCRERIAGLEALGFEWETAAVAAFAARVEALRAFHAEHGRWRPSTKEDKSLRAFCDKVRRVRRHSEKGVMLLNEDQLSMLDAIAFEWLPGCLSMYPEVYQCLNFGQKEKVRNHANQVKIVGSCVH